MRTAVSANEVGCRFGKKPAKVDGGQEQVGVGAPATQTVAQDIGEDLCGGVLRVGIEGSEAECFPEPFAQRAVLAVGVEQFGHGAIGGDAVAVFLEGKRQAAGSEFFLEGAAARAAEPGRQVQGSGQAWQGKAQAGGGIVQGEGCAVQQRLRGGADGAQQAQRFAVGADQEVLAVVDDAPVDLACAGTAAELASSFEDNGAGASGHQFDGGGEAGPAGADDGNA